MNCLECAVLDRTLKAALAKYSEARSAAFYRVSTEIAAIRMVDMERAKASIEEHESVCRFAAEVGPTTNIEVENPGAAKQPAKQSLAMDGAR
jgi:hypothetical protein